MSYRFISFVVAVFILFSCAPSIYVQPLKKGESAVSASLGGPLINIPNVATLPIPNTTVSYGYGVNEKNTVHASLYPTSAIYGVFQLNGGWTREIWKQRRWGASGEASFDYLVDTYEKNHRFYPQLSGNIYFNYQETENIHKTYKHKFIYFGFSNWFILASNKAFGEKQSNRILFNPHIGHQMTKNKWGFLVEIKFLAPYLRNDYVVPDYRSIFGNHGATGIYLGVQYHIK
ncbi:MAG: hypothetical protein WC044_03120 [Crocinitomicaceae bacterium]